MVNALKVGHFLAAGAEISLLIGSFRGDALDYLRQHVGSGFQRVTVLDTQPELQAAGDASSATC